MSPYAFALDLTQRTLANNPPAARLQKLLALQRHLQDELKAQQPATATRQPAEGDSVQVLWARAGTPGEVRDVWCPGTFLGVVGTAPNHQYMVRSATPRSAGPLTRPVAPESVRFAWQVAA